MIPSNVRSTTTVGTQDMRFTYLFNMTEKTNSVDMWLNQIPPLMSLFIGVALLMFLIWICIDICAVNYVLKVNISLSERVEVLQERVLYLVSSVLSVFPCSDFDITYRFAVCSIMLLGMFHLVSTLVLSLIQTNLIVLDLSDVSDSLVHMLATNRQPCLMGNEKYLEYFKHAEPTSVFGQIWQRYLNNPCELSKSVSMAKLTERLQYSFAIADNFYM